MGREKWREGDIPHGREARRPWLGHTGANKRIVWVSLESVRIVAGLPALQEAK